MSTITIETPASITTAKGSHSGTIGTCARWQAEHQGGWASIGVSLGDIEAGSADPDRVVEVNVDGVDFDLVQVEVAVDAVVALLRAELE